MRNMKENSNIHSLLMVLTNKLSIRCDVYISTISDLKSNIQNQIILVILLKANSSSKACLVTDSQNRKFVRICRQSQQVSSTLGIKALKDQRPDTFDLIAITAILIHHPIENICPICSLLQTKTLKKEAVVLDQYMLATSFAFHETLITKKPTFSKNMYNWMKITIYSFAISETSIAPQ